MMDFAPYQDTAPESTRELSPPPHRSTSRSPNPRSPPLTQSKDSFTVAPLPSPSHFTDDDAHPVRPRGLGDADIESGRLNVNLFETSLPLRLDYEAMIAYLLLPPAGGVLLLLMEHKSDYVRFHAWQSSLLFTLLFIIHLIFSWSTFISWSLFLFDIGLIGLLSMHAYQDADTLDRFEMPFFGGLASSFVDSE